MINPNIEYTRPGRETLKDRLVKARDVAKEEMKSVRGARDRFLNTPLPITSSLVYKFLPELGRRKLIPGYAELKQYELARSDRAEIDEELDRLQVETRLNSIKKIIPEVDAPRESVIFRSKQDRALHKKKKSKSSPEQPEIAKVEASPTIYKKVIFEGIASETVLDMGLEPVECARAMRGILEKALSGDNPDFVERKILELLATDPMELLKRYRKPVRYGPFEGFRVVGLGKMNRVLYRTGLDLDKQPIIRIRVGMYSKVYGDRGYKH